MTTRSEDAGAESTGTETNMDDRVRQSGEIGLVGERAAHPNTLSHSPFLAQFWHIRLCQKRALS